MRRSQICVTGRLNNQGVLIGTHRGYLILNPDLWPLDTPSFWLLEPVGQGGFNIVKQLPLK